MNTDDLVTGKSSPIKNHDPLIATGFLPEHLEEEDLREPADTGSPGKTAV